MSPLYPKLAAALGLSLVLILGAPGLRAEVGDEPPVPVRTVNPVVPRDFSQGGSAGLVTISMLIDVTGKVMETNVVRSSHRELEQPAMDAVKKWRFKPAKKDGHPVEIRVSIPIKFEVT